MQRTANITLPIGALVAICALLFSTWAAVAQGMPDLDRDQENPLQLFVGTWTAREEIAGGSPGTTQMGLGEMHGKWGPGKHSVVIEYRSVEGPMKGLSLTQIIAEEPGRDEYSLISVDSFSPGVKTKSGRRYANGRFTFTATESLNDGMATTTSTIVASQDGFTITRLRRKETGEPGPTIVLTFSSSEKPRE